MELALNTIFLFSFLIFPGIVFRRFYFQGPFFKQFKSTSWSKTIINSLFPGIVIQYISFSALFSFIPEALRKDNDIKSMLLDIFQNIIPDKIDVSTITYILIYFLIVLFISYLLARISFYSIRKFRWDHKFPVFRFKNYWHYFFKGEIINFEDFKDIYPKSKVLLVQADIIMGIHESKTRLYKGTLRSYNTCYENGSLKEIFLTDTKRYSSNQNAFVKVPGDIMVIPYERIVNINLRYVVRDLAKKDWFSPFSFITSTLILIIFFGDFLGFFNNTSIIYSILLRIFMILCWLSFNTLVAGSTNTKKNKLQKRPLIIVFLIMLISAGLIYIGKSW